ncbi:MAG: endo-1,4-beta-xylanase [Saprospiraceae bacterium]|nr:endo-1,4-beta-xylanase [Saprospiraceae bacterium]
MLNIKNTIKFLLLLSIIPGCQREEINTCNDRIGLYNFSSYPIGTAIDFNKLVTDSLYKSKALVQFNSITPENIFKAESIHPQPLIYNWTEADSLASFCQNNNKRLHGHTLIWHQQLPQWILDFQGSPSDWEQLMKDHIHTIIAHFKDKVSAWDVVNEAFNEDGTLRNTIWKQKIGTAYIEKAFLFAREADPNVLLFYNDFNLESNPNKLNSVLSLLNNLRNRGVKVDGIGVQMHINIYYPDPIQIANAFHKIVADNYKVHVSELDISVNPLGKDIDPSETLFNKQANLLGSLVLNYNQIPKQYQHGITFWGISDKNSWIRSFYNREDYPLLYDDNYLPKPCYCTLMKTL